MEDPPRTSTESPRPVTILVVGDLHFKISNAPESEIVASEVLREVKERRNLDAIVLLGDTLDRHETINVYPLVRAVEFLRELQDLVPVYLLIGNHDRPNNSDFCSIYSPFRALTRWNNTVVISEPQVLEIRGLSFLFAPYVPDGRFLEMLEKMGDQWKKVRAGFSHQTFDGVRMGSIVASGTDRWNETWPLMICGHVHDYQEVQSNLLYVGTPIQHGFGDTDDKTISLFTFSVTEDSHTHQRIALRVPRKKMIIVSHSDLGTTTLPNGFQLKIQIRGPRALYSEIMDSPLVRGWKQQGVKVQYKSDRTVPSSLPLPSSISRSRFSTTLYDRLSSDPELQRLYSEIIGMGKRVTLDIQPS